MRSRRRIGLVLPTNFSQCKTTARNARRARSATKATSKSCYILYRVVGINCVSLLLFQGRKMLKSSMYAAAIGTERSLTSFRLSPTSSDIERCTWHPNPDEWWMTGRKSCDLLWRAAAMKIKLDARALLLIQIYKCVSCYFCVFCKRPELVIKCAFGPVIQHRLIT